MLKHYQFIFVKKIRHFAGCFCGTAIIVSIVIASKCLLTRMNGLQFVIERMSPAGKNIMVKGNRLIPMSLRPFINRLLAN